MTWWFHSGESVRNCITRRTKPVKELWNVICTDCVQRTDRNVSSVVVVVVSFFLGNGRSLELWSKIAHLEEQRVKKKHIENKTDISFIERAVRMTKSYIVSMFCVFSQVIEDYFISSFVHLLAPITVKLLYSSIKFNPRCDGAATAGVESHRDSISVRGEEKKTIETFTAMKQTKANQTKQIYSYLSLDFGFRFFFLCAVWTLLFLFTVALCVRIENQKPIYFHPKMYCDTKTCGHLWCERLVNEILLSDPRWYWKAWAVVCVANKMKNSIKCIQAKKCDTYSQNEMTWPDSFVFCSSLVSRSSILFFSNISTVLFYFYD